MALWQEFISVEVTSASLAPTLKALLKSQEDLKAIHKLTGLEAQRVVDSFNQVCNCVMILTFKRLTNVCGTTTQAVDSPQLTEPLRKKALQVLCKLCGLSQLLPTECLLGHELVETGIQIGRGGFADVWQGTYRGTQVAIKQLYVHQKDDFTKIYRVSDLLLQEYLTEHSCRGSAKRW